MSGGHAIIQSKQDREILMDSPLSLLYIGQAALPEEIMADSAFQARSVGTPEEGGQVGQRPDVIVLVPEFRSDGLEADTVRKWIGRVKPERFIFPPGIFCAVPASLPRKTRLEILAAGCDRILELPLLSGEIGLKAKQFAQNHVLAQQQHADSRALEKSFAYLDRFKFELKAVKTELMDEKTSLNAALKQIQEMTAERSRLKHTLKEAKKNLGENMAGFSRILVSLIRSRVEQNRGHAERVSDVATYLGREMGLDENRLEDLLKAAMLHEVGLLFMSEAFLSDKEPQERTLSAYDSTLMLQYPVKGADLLDNCPGFGPAARIIRSLNEWSDGTGYPDGLKRRHIPLESKILAGADELDGLRDRPDIDGPDGLLTALEDLAGARLDPVIAGLLGKYVVTRLASDSFKVRGVGLAQLEPGMLLGTALYTATGTKLFSANTELTREAINKIVQYSREYPVDEIVYIKV